MIEKGMVRSKCLPYVVVEIPVAVGLVVYYPEVLPFVTLPAYFIHARLVLIDYPVVVKPVFDTS